MFKDRRNTCRPSDKNDRSLAYFRAHTHFFELIGLVLTSQNTRPASSDPLRGHSALLIAAGGLERSRLLTQYAKRTNAMLRSSKRDVINSAYQALNRKRAEGEQNEGASVANNRPLVSHEKMMPSLGSPEFGGRFLTTRISSTCCYRSFVLFLKTLSKTSPLYTHSHS